MTISLLTASALPAKCRALGHDPGESGYRLSGSGGRGGVRGEWLVRQVSAVIATAAARLAVPIAVAARLGTMVLEAAAEDSTGAAIEAEHSFLRHGMPPRPGRRPIFHSMLIIDELAGDLKAGVIKDS